MNDYEQYIFKSRYARWVPEKGRRENWDEAVQRYIEFFKPRIPKQDREELSKELYNAIYNMEIMPSMRALQTAGKALEKDNVAGYNCSFIAIDDPRAFDEAMYLSMCGCGVGFSVERKFVDKLPEVSETFHDCDTIISVMDSKIGWASSFKQLIALLYSGLIPKWDLSKLRPAGAILKTFGGRSAGPEPLNQLFIFTVNMFKKAAGRKLETIECHDLMCKIADIVVSGGVRRSAMISLSNLTDERMRNAKNGQWWEEYGQRALSNNSVCYTSKPDVPIFLKECATLVESRSGERGIFNRKAAQLSAKNTGRRKWENIDFGTNPCGEINLRSKGLCNLTEVVIRPDDDEKSLKRKVKLATILGTLQSTVTDFRYLRKEWQKNAEEERLLGVSLTGICDNLTMCANYDKDEKDRLSKKLNILKQIAIDTNKEWSIKLKINQSASITCVKPSGTVSQLVNSSSGIHPRFSEFYIRTVRDDKKNPVSQFLKASGVKNETDVTNPNNDVFYFPMKSPQYSYKRLDLSALEQLELWLTYKESWTEHNPSCTIFVKEDEWVEVFNWVYKNFDKIGGLSFFPWSDHVYQQPPYQDVNETHYLEQLNQFPKLDWNKLVEFESEDFTTSGKEAACTSGACEL